MKRTFVATASVVVIIVSLAVIVGWILDITLLKSLSPNLVTMKLSTAISFLLTGISLFTVLRIKTKKNKYENFILTAVNSYMFLTITVLLVSNVFGLKSGVEDLFIREQTNLYSLRPGLPSFGTQLAFLSISFINFLFLWNIEFKKSIISAALVPLIVGALSLTGYILNVPLMYFSIDGYSTAVAVHTGVLFVISSLGYLVLTSVKVSNKHLTSLK